MRKATLVIRDGHRWEFEATEGSCGMLVHRTRRGNVYGIFAGFPHKSFWGTHRGQPFWVGRLIGLSLIPCGGTLGARRIEFECGGVYTFPGVR